jgi:hypothetical protein
MKRSYLEIILLGPATARAGNIQTIAIKMSLIECDNLSAKKARILSSLRVGMHPRYTTCGRALEATLIFELYSMTRKLEHLTGRVNKLNSQLNCTF